MHNRYARKFLYGLMLISLLGCDARNQESKTELGSASSVSEPTPPTPVETVSTLYDETTYIAKEGALVYTFNVKHPVLIQIKATVQSDAPVDIFTINETTNSDEYLKMSKRILVNKEINEAIDDFKFLFGDQGSNEENNSIDGLFNSPLAKKGAYRQYETKWVKLKPSDYSVVIDNTDLFTPTRGDAPVNLKISYKEILELPATPDKQQPSSKPDIDELVELSEQN